MAPSLIVGVVLCSIAIGAGVAVATEGSCSDPSDDTFVNEPSNEVGPGTLDIVNNDHDDTSSTITYILTTEEGFTTDDVDHIRWGIDADDDEDFEGSLLVSGDPLEAVFVNEDTNATSTAVVEHAEGESELTASYSRSELSDIGSATATSTWSPP